MSFDRKHLLGARLRRGTRFAAGLVALSCVLLFTSLSLAQVKAQDGQAEVLSGSPPAEPLSHETQRYQLLSGEIEALHESMPSVGGPIAGAC